MNNETKVSLTITLPGSVMLSKEECLKTTQKTVEKKNKYGKVYKKSIRVIMEDWDKMNKHTMQVSEKDGSKSETITFHTRKAKPARQIINICKDAYIYMISKECPSWSKVGVWNQMNSRQRLEAHLKRTAEHLGGTLYSYNVFEE